MSRTVDAVVLDIEGTTSVTGFVVDVLRPYARERFGALLAGRSGEPEVARALEQVRAELGEPDAGPARIEQALNAWSDEDRKVTPLKTLQGVLWAEGFARGELVSHFYADVVPALRRWHAAGVRLYVYSSGSVAAQRAWFGHSAEGDLRGLVTGWYDTQNAGPKQEEGSFQAIAADTGLSPERLLFLSDHPGELDAARAAGWRAVGVRRPGEPYCEQDPRDHPQARTFEEVGAVGIGPVEAGPVGNGAVCSGAVGNGAVGERNMTAAADLEQAGAVLAAEAARFASFGWMRGTSGNLSLLLSREPFRLAVTASGHDKGELAGEDVVLVDERGAAVSGGRPSAEAELHARVALLTGADGVARGSAVALEALRLLAADRS